MKIWLTLLQIMINSLNFYVQMFRNFYANVLTHFMPLLPFDSPRRMLTWNRSNKILQKMHKTRKTKVYLAFKLQLRHWYESYRNKNYCSCYTLISVNNGNLIRVFSDINVCWKLMKFVFLWIITWLEKTPKNSILYEFP